MGDGAFTAMTEPALPVKEPLQPCADYGVGYFAVTKFPQSGIASLGATKGAGWRIDGSSWCPAVTEGIHVGEVRITLHLNRLNATLNNGSGKFDVHADKL